MVCRSDRTQAAFACLALAAYDERRHCSPGLALQIALAAPAPLFIYDIGQGFLDNAHSVVEGFSILRSGAEGFALVQQSGNKRLLLR